MKSLHRAGRGRLICLSVLGLLGAASAGADSPQPALAAKLGLPTPSPESQGFSIAGLDALGKQMHELVDSRKLATPSAPARRRHQLLLLGRRFRHLVLDRSDA
jgi:hypothetical protein